MGHGYYPSPALLLLYIVIFYAYREDKLKRGNKDRYDILKFFILLPLLSI